MQLPLGHTPRQAADAIDNPHTLRAQFGAETQLFCRAIYIYINDHLPRQARDTHMGKFENKGVSFLLLQGCLTQRSTHSGRSTARPSKMMKRFTCLLLQCVAFVYKIDHFNETGSGQTHRESSTQNEMRFSQVWRSRGVDDRLRGKKKKKKTAFCPTACYARISR